MNSHGDGKPEPVNPDDAVRLLELEMIRQRSSRQLAGKPYRGLRVASFFFLFAIILAALLGFYYVFVSGGLEEFRTRNTPNPTPATQNSPNP